MGLIRYSISKPVSVAAVVIIIVLFGFIGRSKLPVQLTPDVETTQITVKINWSDATPYEIEKDIIEKQEEVLSAFTSLFGMLLLVLATGSGSELYRGQVSVLLGGLAMSTLFTLFVVPSLLAFVIGFERSREQNGQ